MSLEIILPNTQIIDFHSKPGFGIDNPAAAYISSMHSEKSKKSVRSTLNQVSKILGAESFKDCNWSNLRREHVQVIIEVLIKRELAPATVNNYLTLIKGVMIEAWQKKQIDADALERIRTIKRVRGSRLSTGRALARTELREIVESIDSETIKGVRDIAIITVLAGCGLRRSEAVMLDYSSIDFSERSLKVLGKGNKERLAYLPEIAYNALLKWISFRGTEEGALFLRVRRYDKLEFSRITSQAIMEILETRRIHAGIDKFSPHDLRRTFATRMLENGEDMLTVRDAMGHSSVTTTEAYDKRDQDRLKDARDRLKIY